MTDHTQELDEILDDYDNAWWDGRRKAKQAILDWNNKQVEEVLDRLSKELVWGGDMGGELSVYKVSQVIKAERNKLKESKDDQL